jgi:hypothetical protein
MWETGDDETASSRVVTPVSPPAPPSGRNDGHLTTATVAISIAVIDHSTTSGLSMIFAQRKRIGLAFSLLRRELPLTLLFVVDLLFRYAAATVDDVACLSDTITFREGCILLYPRGCNIFAIWNSSLFLFLSAAYVIPTRV